MLVDILCPGSYGDSYESRMLGEMVWHKEIKSFSDLMVLCYYYFGTEDGKREQELFTDFNIYVDGNLVGSYSKGEITIDPIIDWDESFQTGTFRHGRNGYIVNIENAMKYGLNKRSVRVDDIHRW